MEMINLDYVLNHKLKSRMDEIYIKKGMTTSPIGTKYL